MEGLTRDVHRRQSARRRKRKARGNYMGKKECDVFKVRRDGGREVNNKAVSFSAWLSKNKREFEVQ
jgi:hypothetical protein